ncbi:phosphohistidine phosphatase SixA [Stutzerimonas xanthomarina]|nr:phosphohistidine phosphatase SixA [Stutzerimonas xanthomarina]
MKIWLLRHGEAEPRARTDAQRCLTEAGRNEVRRSAAHLVGRPLQMILASPYVRAQQTAELVREVLGFGGMVETVPWMTPDSDIDDAMLYLSQRSDALPMATASLAELEGEGVAAGLMHLRSLRHSNK